MFFGIDLTSSCSVPSACVCLDESLGIVYQGREGSNDDIVRAVMASPPRVIAIDSPLTLPHGQCCLEEKCGCQPSSTVKGRWCEQELARLGMPCYFTTKKSIIKNMVYRAIGLRARLERAGLKVIEVYPYASKVRLFGKPVPRKVTLQGLGWLRDKMAMLLPKSSAFLDIWDHNMCDAAVAAYTAFLYYQGLTEKVGRPEDGFIYIPAVSR